MPSSASSCRRTSGGSFDGWTGAAEKPGLRIAGAGEEEVVAAAGHAASIGIVLVAQQARIVALRGHFIRAPLLRQAAALAGRLRQPTQRAVHPHGQRGNQRLALT